MASAYFRQFAIDNHLTVDYGYMFGRYKGFFISLKETMGSTKILTIMTTLAENKEKLKEVLSVFTEEELPEYQISDMKREKNYIQLYFELPTARQQLVIDFLDKFIESYKKDMEPQIICPLCGEIIKDDEKTAIVDGTNTVIIVHDECLVKKSEAEAKAKEEKRKQETTTKKVVEVAKSSRGPLGAFLYSLIYVAILVVGFFFMQFILTYSESDNSFVLVFQYSPCLLSLCGAPIVTAGFDKFNSEQKTTGRYITIIWAVMISTFLGTFFGFVASLLTIVDNGFIELLELVVDLLKGSGSTTFRWGFYVYIIVSLALAGISLAVKINSKAEAENNKDKFERLE